jgi:hypothetical protein
MDNAQNNAPKGNNNTQKEEVFLGSSPLSRTIFSFCFLRVAVIHPDCRQAPIDATAKAP